MKMFVSFQLVAIVLVLSFQHSFVDSTSCQSANWWRSFDRRGWSVCPTGFPYITGLWRNRAQSPAKDYIYLLEEARCCQSSDQFKSQPKICVHANWVRSLDRTKTWNKCPTGYFLNGLYRSNGHYLHNIEYASCCKPRNHPSRYNSCYNENVWSKFDYNRKGLVSCSKPGHYITGLYRSTCDFMYCIEEFQCCSMAGTTTSCKSTTCLNGGKCTNQGSTFKCTCPAGFTGVRCEKEAQGSCSATGDPHYRTFDGKTYNFMGRCQYVLAKDSGNTFVVLQKNEPCGRSVTCANSVTVTVKGLKIHVPRGGQVTVFGIVVNLPYRNKGVEIIRLGGRTIKITTDVGLTVQYDGVYNVFVTVFARYKGKTLGLCGNFNGNPNDDFKKKDNQLTGDANVFSDSWKVDRSCPNPPEPENPCLKAGSLALEAKKKCALLKGPPFSQCHNSVKQEASFIRDCEYDVCACKDHPISCLCEEYAAYVSTCALVGVNIRWKHLPQFKLCVSPCAVAPCLNGGKCTNYGSNFKCTCPSGFIGVRCETEVQSTCSATGDPHYKTFDGKKYNFMGKCQYVLAKDSANTFEVLAKNAPCNGRHFSCVHAITVTVKGLKIHIAKGGHTTVFGIAVNLPYNKLGVNIAKYGGRTVKITTDIGFTVQYDGVYNVFVTVSGRYKGKTLGLCGNYNGNPNDDFRLKQSNQITGNAYIFSNSWKVHRSCPNEPRPPNPCIHAGSVALEAKKKCALLRRQPFSQCHNTVHQDANFIRDCEYDVCACSNHPVSCLCEEFAAYVTTCSLVDVLIKWKHLPAFKECSSPCAAGPCENGVCSNRGNDFVCECFPGYIGKKCETRTCKNPKALGMENGKIPDSQITASSQWNVNHGPTNARLNFKPKGSRTGAWSARRNDVHQWLQVDFKYKATITEILTQGRNGWGNQWVKSYTVSYSNDGVHFTPYRKGGLTKIFQGNVNRDTIVRQALSPVILARYIRIHPKTWYGHISMRAEFHGCFEDQPCAKEPCLNSGECEENGDSFKCKCLAGYNGNRCENAECKEPLCLGMQDGEILDSQITASSEWNANHGPTNARLNFKPHGGKTGAWSSRYNNRNQWLQVDFELQATVTEIQTQGRNGANQWVKSYTVSYSNDGIDFKPYRHGRVIKVFPGNMNRDTIVKNSVSPVIVARYIRIHPRTWYGHISMRAEFRGCLKELACASRPCENGGLCIDYRGNYVCSCASGYGGKNCEVNIGGCLSKKT